MNTEEMRDGFEAWFREHYEWEIRRGIRGRRGHHLDVYEGEYISEIATHDFMVWCAALSRMKK